MPTNRAALLRYLLIHKTLEKTSPLSRNDIAARVNEQLKDRGNKEVSEDTIKKDLQAMRDDFGAPLEVDKQKWRYTDPHYKFLDLPANMLELLRAKQELEYLFSEAPPGDLERLVSFEIPTNEFPEDELVVLGQALRQQRQVKIEYQPFWAEEPRTYRLHPLMLKENRNRWYLLAREDENGRPKDTIKSFGLERLKAKPQVLTAKAEVMKDFDPKTFFNNAIGITIPDRPPLTIQLDVTDQQAPYFESKPLHHTQVHKGKSQTPGYQRFELKVVPNYELYANLLSLGERVHVVGPHEVRKEVAERIRAAARLYE